MTETATEIYCRLNNVQEIQSEMEATNEHRCFRMHANAKHRSWLPLEMHRLIGMVGGRVTLR